MEILERTQREKPMRSSAQQISFAQTLRIQHHTHALVSLVGLAFTLFLGPLAISTAHAQGSAIVYVESNLAAPAGNSILAYRRDAAGNLTALPGSSFPTGGDGVGNVALTEGQFDSDQNVIVSAEGTRLFAVNSGSDSIAVFDIGQDGTLVPVVGSPFPSGGVNPVSLGLAGDRLYVVHKGADSIPEVLPNYTGFRVTEDGQLVAIADSTIEIPTGSSPTQALISPDSTLLFDANFGSAMLQSFVILPDGRLVQNEPQESPTPLGLQIHPAQPLVYVGFVGNNELAIFSHDQDGVVSFLRTVPNSGRALCWLAINQPGTCLYSANTGDNSVSAYDLADPATPVEVQRVVLRGPGLPFQLALDPAGEFLHVVSQRVREDEEDGNALHILQVDAEGCRLTEVASSPMPLAVPNDTRVQGVAVITR
jgi:6-phosphogluconolactonase (cycloisomerase 2 family)